MEMVRIVLVLLFGASAVHAEFAQEDLTKMRQVDDVAKRNSLGQPLNSRHQRAVCSSLALYGGRIPTILFPCPVTVPCGAPNVLVLALDATEDFFVFQVRTVILVSWPQNLEILLHFGLVSANSEIHKACPQESDRGHLPFPIERMLGRDLPYHAVGGDYIENVQTFEHRGRQRHEAVTRLRALMARHLRVSRFVGDDSFNLVGAGGLEFVDSLAIADFVDLQVCLSLNLALDRLFQTRA